MSNSWEGAIGWLRAPARGGGVLLTVLACGYVIIQMVETGAIARIPWTDRWLWLSLAALSVAYAVVQVPLALAWRRYIILAGTRDISVRAAVSVYARSQLLKYLPLNVFHYIGRHVVMRRMGYSHSSIAFAMFAEAYVISFTAILLAIILGGELFRQAVETLNRQDWLSEMLVITAVIAFLLLPFGFASVLWRSGHSSLRVITIVGVKSIGQYCVFFIGTGMVVSVLLIFVDGGGRLNVAFPILSAVVISWVLGFLVPGSTAGIGIREFVFIGVLTPFLSPSGAVELAILYRLMTVLGDVAFGGIGLLLRGSSS